MSASGCSIPRLLLLSPGEYICGFSFVSVPIKSVYLAFLTFVGDYASVGMPLCPEVYAEGIYTLTF